MKIANKLLGLSAWTALGVSLGVLFAFYKGENNRKKIKDSVSDKVDDLKEQLESLTEKFREKSSDVKETLEEKVDKLLSESEDKSEELIDLLEKKLASIKKKVKK